MFRFVTIIPLELWAIVLLLLFIWGAFGLNGFIITVICMALLLRHCSLFLDIRSSSRSGACT
jgi:hypothetical protein